MISELLTPAGSKLLAELGPYQEQDVLALSARLRAEGYAADVVSAALTQARLRTKAASKFGPFASTMLFTADGVEQATRLSVAVHHAQRFIGAGVSHIADLGCGIGADSMTFAGLGLQVSAIEQDPETALAARFNLNAFPEAEVIEADGRSVDLSALGCDALWLDPARRKNNRRLRDPEEWSPALSTALDLTSQVAAAGIKVAPGIDYEQLPLDAHVQWTSVDGDLVEAVIWRGKAAPTPGRSALILHNNQATVIDAGESDPTASAPQVTPATELGAFVMEPDPAVIRAGAIGHICEQYGLAPVSNNIAYLTGAAAVDSPAVTNFEVLDVLPFDIKKVRAYLTTHEIGVVEIKKRGTDMDPAQWRNKLKLKAHNTQSTTLIATPIAGRHRLIVARRVK